ncbi:MAG: hypothetical protein JWP29_1952 [Rhodoferax sp.]|nr:hypothetical protein [Rhodoferax sp.]
MITHSMDAVCEARDDELDMVMFRAEVRIFYEFIEGGGDGCNEPRYNDEFAFTCALRTDVTPHQRITEGPLLAWAEQYFEANKPDVAEFGQPDPDEARDRAFDMEPVMRWSAVG